MGSKIWIPLVLLIYWTHSVTPSSTNIRHPGNRQHQNLFDRSFPLYKTLSQKNENGFALEKEKQSPWQAEGALVKNLGETESESDVHQKATKQPIGRQQSNLVKTLGSRTKNDLRQPKSSPSPQQRPTSDPINSISGQRQDDRSHTTKTKLYQPQSTLVKNLSQHRQHAYESSSNQKHQGFQSSLVKILDKKHQNDKSHQPEQLPSQYTTYDVPIQPIIQTRQEDHSQLQVPNHQKQQATTFIQSEGGGLSQQGSLETQQKSQDNNMVSQPRHDDFRPKKQSLSSSIEQNAQNSQFLRRRHNDPSENELRESQINFSRQRPDGRRCARTDISCRHYTGPLEKNVQNTPVPITKIGEPSSAPSISIRPSRSPSTTFNPSGAPSLQPSISQFPSISLRPSSSIEPSLLPSGAPSSIPSIEPSTSPSLLPSFQPTTVCRVQDSEDEVFGSIDESENTTLSVQYIYEVELSRTVNTSLNFSNETIVNEVILPVIDTLAADAILPTLFSALCAPFQLLSSRRRLEDEGEVSLPTVTIGVSGQPPDEIASGVDCVGSLVDTITNDCYVVRGVATLYFPFKTFFDANITSGSLPLLEQQQQQQQQQGSFDNNTLANIDRVRSEEAIKAAIESAAFNNADESIVGIYYRTSIPTAVTPRSESSNRLPWWAWLLIALAILFFNLCLIGLWFYRRRQLQERQAMMGEVNSEEPYGDAVGLSPFNELEDEKSSGFLPLNDLEGQNGRGEVEEQVDLFSKDVASGDQSRKDWSSPSGSSSSSSSLSGSSSSGDASEATEELLQSSDDNQTGNRLKR